MAKRFDRLGWAMDQPDLTPTQRFVLMILADMSNEIGECWPSKTTIAERTGYGVATVKRALNELVSFEIIKAEPRFFANGKQTSNFITLCLGGRGITVSPPEDVDDDHESSGRGIRVSPRGDHSEPHVEPANRTSRKNNSSTTSKTRSSRRAARARDDEGWADPASAVFDKPEEQDDEPDSINPRGGPDSAWGLNGYYRDSIRTAGNGFLGNTNDGALRKFFAAAKRQGVTPDTLRTMVDIFVVDEQLFTRAKDARWRVFLANSESLRQRAIAVDHKAFENVEEFGGAIPQHILDEILAEAG